MSDPRRRAEEALRCVSTFVSVRQMEEEEEYSYGKFSSSLSQLNFLDQVQKPLHLSCGSQSNIRNTICYLTFHELSSAVFYSVTFSWPLRLCLIQLQKKNMSQGTTSYKIFMVLTYTVSSHFARAIKPKIGRVINFVLSFLCHCLYILQNIELLL